MRIIKLGGSLLNDRVSLTHCLAIIEQKYRDNVVIVPGGGVYADLIRTTQQQWKFSDETAHQMAILAMKQVALLFNNIKPAFVLSESVTSIQKKIMNQGVTIWSPDIQELNDADIKASWDVTSDSLAAWLASQLGAIELILIKSAEILANFDAQKMQNEGFVDKSFNTFTKNISYKITIINIHQFNEHNFT